MRGTIIKGIGGFYTVADEDGNMHACKARGRFRLEKLTPLVGDEVLLRSEKSTDLIDKILPRRNQLDRPPIANIDVMILVMAAINPEPDFLLADKLLIQAARMNIKPYICINKCDIAEEEAVWAIAEQYAAYETARISAKTGAGIKQVESFMKGAICCLAGQSGVGKSKILNSVSGGLKLKTGDISERTQRGKHTTRHVELLRIANGGMVADTPGFSLFDITDIDDEEIAGYYPEFLPYLGKCKFTGCLHDSEPNCAVKEALRDGKIVHERYERYIEILYEVRKQRKER
jgi:ribosome biogenesis GTPase / thiamine phosphate phosphatase